MATAKKASQRRKATAAKKASSAKEGIREERQPQQGNGERAAKKATAKKPPNRPRRRSPRRRPCARKPAAAQKAGGEEDRRRRRPWASAAAPSSHRVVPTTRVPSSINSPLTSASRGMPAGAAGAAAPTPRLPDEFYAARKDEPLGDQAFAEAAQALGCDVAAVRAVAEVESRGSGFDAQGRPTILYERHVFSRNTAPKGKFDAQAPDISFGDPTRRAHSAMASSST